MQGFSLATKRWFDGGGTWTRPRELVEGDQTGGRGPVKNKPIYLKNGNILAPASLEKETWDAFTDISEDEGVTWEKSSLVPLEREGRGSGQSFGKGVIQPSLWQDDDGSVQYAAAQHSVRHFPERFDG